MKFKVLDVEKEIPAGEVNCFFLQHDNWDDWFKFCTLFSLTYVSQQGEIIQIGILKIAQKDQEYKTKIPNEFSRLDENFFSIGQDAEYYENLQKISSLIREEVLISLQDMAFNEKIFEDNKNLEVTKISLLRSVSLSEVKGQFKRIAHGGVKLSEFHFSYKWPEYFTTNSKKKIKIANPLELDFHVTPNSSPPSNIHVIIGRNAVGKTVMLNNMVRSFADKRFTKAEVGNFSTDITGDIFANIVTVSFSAFDDNPPIAKHNLKDGVEYSYIGLKSPLEQDTNQSTSPKSPKELTGEFVSSLYKCTEKIKSSRWKRAIEILESDPIFKDSECISLLNNLNNDLFKSKSKIFFNKLSSGHKIVLLTITRLVETVQEKSLVIIDEPENHLHPPLLSAFIRSVSELLINRNGVAIIATHSPVVLQEVPRKCVWQLKRSGLTIAADRPTRESFGENVGTLTSDVFGLEVIKSGFHTILNDQISKSSDYESIINNLDGQLGIEGRSILRSLLAQINKE